MLEENLILYPRDISNIRQYVLLLGIFKGVFAYNCRIVLINL